MTYREEQRLLNAFLKKRVGDPTTGLGQVTKRRERNARRKRAVESNRKWRKRHPSEYRKSLKRRAIAYILKQNGVLPPRKAKTRAKFALIEAFFL